MIYGNDIYIFRLPANKIFISNAIIFLEIMNTKITGIRVINRKTIFIATSWTLPFEDSLMRYKKLIPSNAGLIKICMHECREEEAFRSPTL